MYALFWSRARCVFALPVNSVLCSADVPGAFTLVDSNSIADVWVSADADRGLTRVARLFQEDIARVTGRKPRVLSDAQPQSQNMIVIGVVGECPLLDELLRQGKLEVSDIEGRWEVSVTQVVNRPFPGVETALVIAGSDKRGAMFGVLDLSEQMGVSPWYWWADVPVQKRDKVYVSPGRHVTQEPTVKYRGIFINDEAPALADWAQEKFGGCNSKFYERVYELMLRLRANYLWPAMWGRSLFDDDPQSAPLAEEYGIVLGTTHHEPMMRSHVEWQRYGRGPWNYEKNQENLREFWREGIRRMDDRESIVTVGMRGDGDEPMTDEANIELLKRIVHDQRQIIEEVTGRPAEEQPQLWALYKEVQEYYDRGMRVPDDITLLLCDDNWGNLRKLPRPGSPPRPGGYGIYYHFDYVGGPRNYKWINTNPLPRVWEQMNLAYRHGVREIWLVNVGDIKPMELPTEFFLDMAWDPHRWTVESMADYPQRWAARQFGEAHADAIGEILAKYAKYNARRKPELLDAKTYSLVNYREAERVVEEFRALVESAQEIERQLPAEYDAAYFQLVLHPVLASANLNELYFAVAQNHLYAQQGRAATNTLAARAEELFAHDREITERYHALNDGRWNHMMSQTHIGYTYWQQPEKQVMPEVETIAIPEQADMGVATEGSAAWWPSEKGPAVLPEIAPYDNQERYIEVFNRGKQPFEFTVDGSPNWLKVVPSRGPVDDQVRLHVTVDWKAVPAEVTRVPLTIRASTGQEVEVQVVLNQTGLAGGTPGEWIENDGYVSIDAEQYARSIEVGDLRWQRVPDLGRTAGAVMPVPVTAQRQASPTSGPHLEYDVLLKSAGEVTVTLYLSPTLDYYASDGFRYAVSFDDEAPQIVNIHADSSDWGWQQMVANNINRVASTHEISQPGKHVLKLWMVDPGVVVQKLVIETGRVRESYLGPPASPRVAGE